MKENHSADATSKLLIQSSSKSSFPSHGPQSWQPEGGHTSHLRPKTRKPSTDRWRDASSAACVCLSILLQACLLSLPYVPSSGLQTSLSEQNAAKHGENVNLNCNRCILSCWKALELNFYPFPPKEQGKRYSTEPGRSDSCPPHHPLEHLWSSTSKWVTFSTPLDVYSLKLSHHTFSR